ncbi:dUTP diphosphatase [Metamycoplasma hyosynoviae]|uniref:dUTP diphosphatase n=1 Tax=Metamycoplasma hyosynoviae TaxID=29559 RepID=UPI00235F1196|nr:dUTP diphosphatase [Metamycoplasma hyosynoviae]MDD1377564.1 dUTP diphosphatase [Metamycoplasma hyosynoviae]
MIFETQVSLDETLLKKVIDPNEKYLDTKKVIALLVELGEFANEVKSFKYWKKHKEIDNEKMQEEFADGVHFLTSLALVYKLDSEIKIIQKSQDFSLQLAYVYKTFVKLLKKVTVSSLKVAYGAYLGLGKIVGITEESLCEAYFKKNKINFKRIADNY